MPYSKSRSRKAYEEAIIDISERIKKAKNSKIDNSFGEYIIAASIFLAHAEMENYIYDVFHDFADAVQVAARRGSVLPSNLRAHLFIRKSNVKAGVSRLIIGGPERDFINSVVSLINGHAGTLIDESRELARFTGVDVLVEQKYPSKDNLKVLFNRIGISNIFDELGSILKEDCGMLLDSIGGLRTQLAHNASLPGIGYKDVKDVIKKAERFIGGLDRAIYRVVVKYFRSSTCDNCLRKEQA